MTGPQQFLCAFGVSALSAVPVLRALQALKSRQTVSQHAPETHQKKQGTPTMGGFIALIGISIAWIFGNVEPGYWIALLGFAAIGFVDDFVIPRLMPGKRGLGWIPKILMQVCLAVAAVMVTKQDMLVSAFLVFLVLFFSNAYNFSDGLDGLAGTLGVTIAIALTALGGPMHAIALAGGLCGFLLINAPPARVFMGDVGSLPIGAVFGLMVGKILTPANQIQVDTLFWALVVLSLVMLAEIVPVPLQIFWVKVFKKRLFPYTPIHHAFEKAGWPESRVVWIFGITQVVCAVLAISLVNP